MIAAIIIISVISTCLFIAKIWQMDKEEELEEKPIAEIANHIKRQINRSKTYYHLSNSIKLRDKLLLCRQNDPNYLAVMESIATLIQVKEAELIAYTEKQAERLRDAYRESFQLPTQKKKK